MAKQGGKSKRPRSANAAARGQRCFAMAQKQHENNCKAQEKRHAANLASGGPTPWELAQQARARRREILKFAWNALPWRPGDAVGREKSVHEWILAHRVPSTA